MTMTPVKALVEDARGTLEKRHPGLFNPDDPLDLAEYPGLKNLSTEWIARLLVEAIESTALRSFMDGGWRPIETAPFDRPFLAMSARGDMRKCWRFKPSSRTDSILSWPRNGKFPATHWMPLPTPPAVEGEAS